MHFLQGVAKTSMLEFARECFNGNDQAKCLEFVKLLVDAIPEPQLLTIATEAVYIRYPFAAPPRHFRKKWLEDAQIEEVDQAESEDFYGSPAQSS